MRMMDELGAASSSNLTSSSIPSSSSSSDTSSKFSILQNYALISAVTAFAIAQTIKVLTTWYQEKQWDAKQLVASGGMPSSHSSAVQPLAMAIRCQDGFGGPLLAVAMILACVVMHDAFGVRLHAGKQEQVLNQIVYGLPAEHPLAETGPLRELLGHTPLQVVAGSVLGLVIACRGHLIRML